MMPAMASLAAKSESELQAQLQATLNIIPAYSWYADPSGALTFVNKRHADYLGLPKDHPLRFGIPTGAAWDAHIPLLHPDDHEEARRVWSTCLRTGSAAEMPFRVRNAAGEYRWFLTRAEPLRSSDGTLLYWIGVNLEIDDAKRAEDALRKSEKELREVVDTIPALIHTARPDGYIDYFNKRWLEYFGVTLDEVAGWNWTSFIHAEDVEGILTRWRACLMTGEIFEYETRVLGANGEYRWMFHRKVPLRDANGNIVKWYGSSMDIHERKTAEEALRSSEAYLAEAQRLSQTGSFGWRPDTGEIVWSDETYRIFGCDHAVKPTIDLVVQRVHPEDRPDFLKVTESASAGVTQFEHTYRLRLPDGSVKHVHALAHASQDASGNREFVGAVTDITERKTAEEALRSSEAYLAEAQRLSRTGSWAWSAATGGPSYWSEECHRVLGFDPANRLPGGEDFFQRVHPDDRNGFRELAETAIRDKAEFEADYRVVHSDGRVRDIHVVAHPVVSTSGHLAEFVGTVMDVTERKRAEEELRRSEAEFRQILDLAPQLVGVFGTDLERLYANRMALDYFGVRLDEWRQTSMGSQTHPDDSERVNACWDRALASGSAYEVELRLRKHDGSYRWFLARYNPVRDDKGQIMRWYVASTDIDERKRAEEKLKLENAALREEIDQTSMFEEIVGTSPALQAVLSGISKVAPSDSTVLITGETGTGKELVARAIHKRSQRSGRAFVSVNCAAIPRDLVLSELFGHERGAFTGAMQRRLGRFEMADGGTIFLDEVGELSSDTQVALLRVLQEREFERVGGGQPIHVDVRVIAATNRDLQAAVANGTFRQDLFYRLNVFPIEVPPLRERKSDILILVEYFAQRYASRAGKTIRSIEKKTLDRLQSYQWPGNIRELQNVIERSVIVSETETFSIDESWLSRQAAPSYSKSKLDLAEKVTAQEKELIEAALRESGGRVYGPSGAAAKLGMPRSTLETKIRSLKISKHRFKS
jgi:PAS domain S-box-containing protein